MNSYIQGILAGYGIAIPVGAIAVLIVETSIRHGFRGGFAAGAGTASADILFACLAALAGQALAAFLIPIAIPIRWLSALLLIGLGSWNLWQIFIRQKRTKTLMNQAMDSVSPHHIYLRFIGLTLVNPLTVTYFAALILGGNAVSLGWMDRLAFVLGAGLASLSWQTLLAALGSLAHRRMSPRVQQATSLIGNLIVIGLGLRLFF